MAGSFVVYFISAEGTRLRGVRRHLVIVKLQLPQRLMSRLGILYGSLNNQCVNVCVRSRNGKDLYQDAQVIR